MISGSTGASNTQNSNGMEVDDVSGLGKDLVEEAAWSEHENHRPLMVE